MVKRDLPWINIPGGLECEKVGAMLDVKQGLIGDKLTVGVNIDARTCELLKVNPEEA